MKRLWVDTSAETAVVLHGVGEKCSSGTSFGKQHRYYNRPNLNFSGLNVASGNFQ